MTGLSISVPVFSLVHCAISHTGLVSTLSALHFFCISLSPASSSLLTPVPSLKWSYHFLSQSQYHLCIPLLDVSTNFISTNFYPLPLSCFSSFFPILCSINLISIFLAQPFLQYLLFLHRNFILPPSIFFLLILPSSPYLLASQLPGFFFLLFLHYLYISSFCPFASFHVVTSVCLSPQKIPALIPVKGSYFWHWCPAGTSLLGEGK